jgi:mannose/cellobiose epimerase-like protein (N-acyl-D-glucosamine 2-epimerase family)
VRVEQERRRRLLVTELCGHVGDGRVLGQEMRREGMMEVIEPEARERRAVKKSAESLGDLMDTERRPGTPPSTDKVWWVQAEGLVALSEALAADAAPPADFEAGLRLLLDWIWNHQRFRDGIWAWSTDERGVLRNPTKAGNWKAGYHEVRAMCRFIDVWA